VKLVTAVLRPHTWEAVRSALERIGVSGVTVTEALGFGRQKGHTEAYRGAEYDVALVPRVRIEVVVDDLQEAEVVAAVLECAPTGRIGDGKLWVLPVDSVVRVRSAEVDGAAP
jgi:nitrogen regulatory protein P-II 1